MLYWSLLVIAMMRQYDFHNVQRDVIFKQDDLLRGKNCNYWKSYLDTFNVWF